MNNQLAFVFPGQGSQALKMLASVAEHFSIIEKTFERASDTLGYDLWQLTQKGPFEQLNQTYYTQPALLAAGFALWQLWQSEKGKKPAFLAGHSLGEYTAYTCASSFSFETAIELVAKRGAYMQEAVQNIESTMAVIVGLSYEEVARLCQKTQTHEIVAPSAHNTLDQIIISGHTQAVTSVMREAKEKGARLVKALLISIPAHCELMKPAVPKLKAALNAIVMQMPTIPVVSNAYSVALSEMNIMRESLVVQLYQPVNWVQNVQYLLNQGVNCFVECGPQQVLTGLIRRISPQSQAISIGDIIGLEKALIEN